MNIKIRAFEVRDSEAACAIWNRVVRDGVAFPQENELNGAEGIAFFEGQTYTGVAEDSDTGEIVGLYILHPNNVGRCGHIANASYAVDAGKRGCHIGASLVTDCMEQARQHGYRILQFNAVVASNAAALHLYQTLGFHQLGEIPGGFRNADGTYEAIIPHYIEL